MECQKEPEGQFVTKAEFVNKEDLKNILSEYQRFLSFKGDLLLVATAFILGTAFENLTKSISNNLIMPFINFILLQTGDWQKATYSPVVGLTFSIGPAIASIVDFILLSMILFFMIKWLGRLDKLQPPTPPPSLFVGKNNGIDGK